MMLPTTVTPALTREIDPLTLIRAMKRTAESNSKAFASAQHENARLTREVARLNGDIQELKAACAALAVTCLTLIGMVLA